MLELILKGRPRFYLWLCFLGAIIGLAFVVYLFQLNMGLTLTGLGRRRGDARSACLLPSL